MKPHGRFDNLSVWFLLIRYKISNFIIGYNIEDALEEHYSEGWNEGYTDCLAFFHDGTESEKRALNHYKKVRRRAE